MATATLADLHAAWSAPFLADPSDDAASAARGEQTRELAGLVLAAGTRARVGDLTIVAGSWSRKQADYAYSVADPAVDLDAFEAALGSFSDATLTSDGDYVARDLWCRCASSAAAGWVRYEGWTAEGRSAHGFACPSCRALAQVG